MRLMLLGLAPVLGVLSIFLAFSMVELSIELVNTLQNLSSTLKVID
jgi:hypothetical protein